MQTSSIGVLVLLSGGMDSAVVLAECVHRGFSTACLFFNYGQRGANHEWHFSRSLADYYKVPALYQRVILPDYSSSLLERGGSLKPTEKSPQGLPKTYVPARNLILVSMAAGLAYENNYDAVAGGWNSVDTSYPDCSPRFRQLAEEAACVSIGRPEGKFLLIAPVLYQTKIGIVKRGQELGVPWKLTRSCYGDSLEPCGQCDSCMKRAYAFYRNGIVDPTFSESVWRHMMDYMNLKEDTVGDKESFEAE